MGVKSAWIIFFFCLATGIVCAQFGSQQSLYMHERYGFNPAFGGMERSLYASLQYRSQWTGLQGNPETRFIHLHMPMYIWNGAVGFQIGNESIGAESGTSFAGSYNYIMESGWGLVSLGVRAGILQRSLDGSKLRTPEGVYEGGIIDHHDGILPETKVSGVSPLAEAGVYVVTDVVEAGLSMTGFYPSGITLGEGFSFSPKPVFHFFGEYRWNYWDNVSILPSAYVKSDLVQTQLEVALTAQWDQIVTAGMGYRGFGALHTDAILLNAGVRLSPKFYLQYGYDIGISDLRGAHQGSHELLIQYNLGEMVGAGLPPRIIYNPRNL